MAISTDLTGKTALVTGASSGIGRAVAQALAACGSHVFINYPRADEQEQAEQTRQLILREGGSAEVVEADVCSEAAVEAMFEQVLGRQDRLDILVNNAGIARAALVQNITLEDWQAVMGVHVTGTFLFTQALLPDMVHAGWGRVVNVASIAGLMGGKSMSAYTASKHAVVGFTRSMAAEVSGTGVTVNAVCPGYVDTPLTDDAVGRIVFLTGKSPEQARQLLLNEAGQSRLLAAGEVADAVVRLCLEGSASANGEAVVLDGKDGRV